MASDPRLLVRPTPPPEPEPMLWSMCAWCWGAGRIAHEEAGRYVMGTCARCLGLGQTAREAA